MELKQGEISGLAKKDEIRQSQASFDKEILEKQHFPELN